MYWAQYPDQKGPSRLYPDGRVRISREIPLDVHWGGEPPGWHPPQKADGNSGDLARYHCVHVMNRPHFLEDQIRKCAPTLRKSLKMGRSRARRFRFTHLVGVGLISEFPTFATKRTLPRAESGIRIHTDPLKVAGRGELRAWRFRRTF